MPCKFYFSLFILISSFFSVFAQDTLKSEEIEKLLETRLFFPIDSSEPKNLRTLPDLKNRIDTLLGKDSITLINIKGYSSVDGSVSLNDNLAKKRAETVENWLIENYKIGTSKFNVTYRGEDWDLFERLIKENSQVPDMVKILDIAKSAKNPDSKEYLLRSLDEGTVWDFLAKNIFPKMRVADLSFWGYSKTSVDQEIKSNESIRENPTENIPPELEDTEVEYTEEIINNVVEGFCPLQRNFYIKTNAPAWLLLITNIAFEIDIVPHLSFNLPVYYSGWDYFTGKLKFRTFTTVPEFRYWVKESNNGFFMNAHFGLCLFNYAKGQDYRYQSYGGNHPALGGGIGLGYRFFFCNNKRWTMEAAIGAGVYRLNYSIFENIPNGLIIGQRKRIFYGIDQVALSFSYSFGLNRKEVKK